MYSKSLVSISVVVMLALLTSHAAALKIAPWHSTGDLDEQWKPLGGGSIGQGWSNPENWWHNAVPTATQKAKVNRVPGPIISGSANVYQLFISEGNGGAYMYSPCTTVIKDGALVNVGHVSILGYYPQDNGTLKIDGGTVNIASHMFVGRAGSGKLVMNGGVLNVGGNFAISFQGGNGRVELNGGILHISQLTYEYPNTEADPNTPLPGGPGRASIDISGGTILHDGTATPAIYQEMINAGKLTAYNGKGNVIVRFDPVAQRTIIKGQKTLWDYSDINIVSSSTVVDEGWTGLDRMFKPTFEDPNSTIFLDDPAGAGAVYFVQWNTADDVTVKSFELTAERDNESGTPPYGRAVRHFTLKAKSAGSSTYNLTLYDGDLSYTGNIADLIYTLPQPVSAKEFRAEFIGNDIRGVRIRRFNADGERMVDYRWNIRDIIVNPITSPVINDPNQPGAFDIANMFENRAQDNLATIFADKPGVNPVYTVLFRPIEPAEVHSINLVAEHDSIANSYQRAIKHFTLRAKSIGSNTYDITLFDGDVAVPYTNNVYRLTIDLPTALTTYEYKAEFTGNDSQGVRIRELNAIGVSSGIQPLWNPDNVVIGNRSPFVIENEFYDIANSFQTTGQAADARFASTIFENAPVDNVYFVEWKTKTNVQVNAFNLLATHDSTSMLRAMKRFVLKAKSPGSSIYDLTLSSVDFTLPYNAPYDANVLDYWVSLAAPVVAKEFRAEFTGNDTLGVRIGELDAIGTIIPEPLGDLDGDSTVSLDDFAIMADSWAIDNSGASQIQTQETFESYVTIPNASWANWLGQTSSRYNNLYLETSVVKTGIRALRWTYDLDPGVVVGDDKSGIVYTLPTPVDICNYSKMRVWLQRPSTNSIENYLSVRFMWPDTAAQPHDSKAQAEALILSAQGSTRTDNGLWTEWVIDLKNDLVFNNLSATGIDDIYNVGSMIFYVNNRLEFSGGPGTIRIDDIRFESDCSYLDGDLNGDCKVDIVDLSEFIENWLEGR